MSDFALRANMPGNMKTAVLFVFIAACAAAQTPDSQRQLLEYTRSHYTKYDYRIPMRDGVQACLRPCTCRKTRSAQYPILMQRTPYSVGPYGIDNYRAMLGPSEQFTQRRLHLRSIRTYAGAIFPKVRSWICARTKRVTPGRKIRTKAPTLTTRSTGWSKTFPTTTAASAMWGISYPGFYAAHGMINAHPALKAVSPQAPDGRCWQRRRLLITTARFTWRPTSVSSPASSRAPEPARPERRLALRFRHAGSVRFLSERRTAEPRRRTLLQGKNEYWTDLLKHTTYDQFWRERGLEPADEKNHSRRAFGGRLVRRRRSRRHGEIVPRPGRKPAGFTGNVRDGAVVAWRLVPRRRRETGRSSLQRRKPGISFASISSSRFSCTT